MKKLIVAVLTVQLALVGFWGYSYAHADKSWIDAETGYMIKAGTPEDVITSHNELINKGSYKEAVKLESEKSRIALNAEMLKAQNDQLRLQDAKLAKVFSPKVNRDIAVVGYIRTVMFSGNQEPTPIYKVDVVKKNQNNSQWEVIQDIREIPEDRVMKMFKNVVALDDELLADKSLYSEFSKDQQKAIINQIKGMREWHVNAISEFELYQKQKENAQKETTVKKPEKAQKPEAVKQPETPKQENTTPAEEEYDFAADHEGIPIDTDD